VRAASRLARAALLSLACLCLLACQAVVGDFEVAEPDQDCDENRYRCMGELLYCVRTANGKEEPTLIEKCNSAAECDSAGGKCTVCKAGDVRCNGQRLETCAPDRASWTLRETCPEGEACNVASVDCRACQPGEMQCSGAGQLDLQVCNDDHKWGPPEPCATSELCDLSVQTASANPSGPRCIPAGCPVEGVYRCVNGVELERCPPDRIAWIRTDVCASEDLCTTTANDPARADANGTHCVGPQCQPNEFRCNGNLLEQCNQDLQGWGLYDECILPFVCDLNEGACSGPCTPGENQCNGAVLEVCNDRQTWEPSETCASAALCTVAEDAAGNFYGSCEEPVCPVALAYTCELSRLLQCREDHTGWDEVEVCASEVLCNAIDGVCTPPGCEAADTYRCNPTRLLELQYCPPDLTEWQSQLVCETTQSCDATAEPPGCIDTCPDVSVVCNGNVRQVCSGETGAPVWTPEPPCPTAALCQCALDSDDADECLAGIDDAGRCGEPLCGGNLPSVRCSDNVLETCDPSRNRWNETDCTIACMEPATGTPYCAQCRSGEAECAGMGIRTCNAQTGLYNAATSCSIACKENGRSDYCADCAVGSAECLQNGDLRSCNATSQRWNAPGECPNGCMAVSGPDYCAECAVGDAECVDGELRTCDPVTRRWNAPTECALACMPASGADYCAECTAGDAECASGDLRTCNATTRRWNTPSTPCTLACMPASGADYCAECTAPDAQCGSGGLETCDMTTRLWSDPAPCTIECIDDLSGPDYCADCTPTASECLTTTTRQTCSTEGRWDDPETCDLGCFGTSPNAYCGNCDAPEDCAPYDCVEGLCEGP
jgi:hypothetical protein